MCQESCHLFIGDVRFNELYFLQTCDDLGKHQLRDAGYIHLLIYLQLLQTQTRPQVIEQSRDLQTEVKIFLTEPAVTC